MVKGKASDARILKPDGSQASGSATESDLRTAIAHLTEEREGLKNEAIKLRMRIGSMEDDAALQRSHERNAQVCHEKQLAALTEAHERLRTTIIAFKEGTQPRTPHPDKWERLEIETIQKTLNVVLAELDALLSPREGTQVQEDQELTDDFGAQGQNGKFARRSAAATDREISPR